MRLKNNVTINKDGDYYVLVGVNESQFHGFMRFNETAEQVMELLKTETDREQLIAALINRYRVEESVAAADVDIVLEKLREIDALAE